MDKFYTILHNIFHRAPLVISFLSTHRSHGRNAPPNFFTPSIVHLLHKVHPGCKVWEMPYLFIVAGASKCLL